MCSDFITENLDDLNSNFSDILKLKWDEIHSFRNVFRYKIENIRERIVDKKYFLQLNPNRSTNRRTPEEIEYICQPFDPNKFNFTKVSKDEIVFLFTDVKKSPDIHAVLVNVSPISQYHCLLCPSLYKYLPQVVTAESLQLAIDIMLLAKDRNLRIGFNSLCGLASVNHLHYHIFIEKKNLPIETAQCQHLKGPVYCLNEDYPVPGFCFEITQKSVCPSKDIFKLIEVLLKKSIAHNIFISRGSSLEDYQECKVIRVVIWPRKSSKGAKQLAAFNVAVCELSGWFPIFDEVIFNNITAEGLELELKKWKLDNFEDLCDELKLLY